ncbi:phenylalanine--tRNA ligase subunit alpha, partial [Mesorhizobium sp. M7A.F.Ca.CA.001.06.1.1]
MNDATTGLDTLENSLLAEIASAADEPAIEAVRIAAFGKK